MDWHAALYILTIFAGVGFFGFLLSGSRGLYCYGSLMVWALCWAALAATR